MNKNSPTGSGRGDALDRNSMKLFSASHPLPLNHTYNAHSGDGLILNGNSTDNHWGSVQGDLNPGGHHTFRHQTFRTPAPQRNSNAFDSDIGDSNDSNFETNRNKFENTPTFSKTPFGPTKTPVRDDLHMQHRTSTFHRTPGAAASFPSRASGSSRPWSSYDGRGHSRSGSGSLRKDTNVPSMMERQSLLNDIRDNKVGDADSNLLNQQFMEQAAGSLHGLPSWNQRTSNGPSNSSSFPTTPGTLESRVRHNNFFPNSTPSSAKFADRRFDNTRSFPPRTPNRHVQENLVRQTTPFGFGLGSGGQDFPTTYVSMGNSGASQSPIHSNNAGMSRNGEGDRIFSRGQNGHVNNRVAGSQQQHPGQPDIVDLLEKKFSSSQMGNSMDGINHSIFLQTVDKSNSGLNPNAPVFDYSPTSPSKLEQFRANGGILDNTIVATSSPSFRRRHDGANSNVSNTGKDRSAGGGYTYGNNLESVSSGFGASPKSNFMQRDKQSYRHQRLDPQQSRTNSLSHPPQRGINYNSKRQQGAKTRANVNTSNSRGNKRTGTKKQVGSGGARADNVYYPNTSDSGMAIGASAARGKRAHRHQGAINQSQQKASQQNDKKANAVSRQLLKEFYLLFKNKEKQEGSKVAKLLGLKYLGNKNLDIKARAKIYCLLADLEKRDGRYEKAREYFGKANELDPIAKEGWLEYSKMEEDCGNFDNCRDILLKGLSHDRTNENLLKSLIKLEEKMGNIEAARQIVTELDDFPLSSTWKIMLESALMEARAGENSEARQLFEMLMEKVPWSSAVYFEAARFEEKRHCDEKAINIVSRGLIQNSRFGPLWFCAFRLHEKIEVKRALSVFDEGKAKGKRNVRLTIALTHTQAVFDKATEDVAKELQWKVSFERAKMFERAALTFISHLAAYYDEKEGDIARILSNFDTIDTNYAESLISKCRDAYKLSLQQCQNTLHWKVWLAAARMELWSKNVEAAKGFLALALEGAPLKSKTQVYLETARLEEFEGRVDEARKLLKTGQERSRKEWKIYLESVLLEIRYNERAAAILEAENALEAHPGTGRLWAILIQLKSVENPAAQFSALERALSKVPKSGEVWCEAARLALNPTMPFFNLEKAQLFLKYAIQFTPQYGDSFLEFIRYLMLVHAHDMFLRYLLTQVSSNDKKLENFELSEVSMREFIGTVDFKNVVLSSLNQQCLNADPNYGVLWFHCKNHPFDTAQNVFQCAFTYLCNELNSLSILEVYCDAFLRSWKKAVTAGTSFNKIPAFGDVSPAMSKYMLISGMNFKKEWGDKVSYMPVEINSRSTLTSSNKGILVGDYPSTAEKASRDLFYDAFATGLVEVNRLYYCLSSDEYSKDEKRKLMYGSDQILV